MITKSEVITFAAKSAIGRKVASQRGQQTKRAKQWQSKFDEIRAMEKASHRKSVAAMADAHFKDLHGRVSAELELHARKLLAGEMDAAQWETAVRKTLRPAYDTAARLGKSKARGVVSELSGKDANAVTKERYDEHKYLKGFHDDIVGKYSLLDPEQQAKKLAWRSQMYADALTGEMNDSFAAHLPQEQIVEWVVDPTAANCDDCLEQGALGPRPISELPFTPASGMCACLTNCKCSLETVMEREVQSVTQSGTKTRTIKTTLTGAPIVSAAANPEVVIEE